MNALTYKNNPNLLKKYLSLNDIKGCYLVKEESGYQVYEGTEDYTGLLLANFLYKRDALQAMKEWCECTGLPRFKNFNC